MKNHALTLNYCGSCKQELWPEYSQEDLSPSLRGSIALPALWGVIKHILKLLKILTAECSNWRALLCVSCLGGVLQFRAMIYDRNVLLWWCCLSQWLPCTVTRAGYLCFGRHSPCEQLWVNHGQPGPKKTGDVCLQMCLYVTYGLSELVGLSRPMSVIPWFCVCSSSIE